jgi:hypothetical protein
MNTNIITTYYSNLENTDFEADMLYLMRFHSLWGQELFSEDEIAS